MPIKHLGRVAEQERREGVCWADEEVPMAVERYRLVSRCDFDGVVCAVLLRQLDLVDDEELVGHLNATGRATV